jgi:hypothetical protein
MLRGMSEPRREGLTGEWKKLRSKKLHNLHSSPKYNKDTQIKGDKTGRAVSGLNRETGMRKSHEN